MMKIKLIIEKYRSPKTKTFILNHSLDKVYSAMEKIQNSNVLTRDLDFDLKYFTGSEFSISLIRLGYRQPLPSVVNGTISVNNDNQILINCKRQNSVLGQVFIWICLIVGVIFLFKFIFDLSELRYLVFSILLLLLFPYLTIWYALMTETVLYERFKIYLRKSLKQ